MQPTLPGIPIPPTVYVSFSAEIVPHTTESLISTMANLANQKVTHVYLMISTPGGSVMHGMNLYNVLRAFPVQVNDAQCGKYRLDWERRILGRERTLRLSALHVYVSWSWLQYTAECATGREGAP